MRKRHCLRDQYDYNKNRVLSGKDALPIADVRWDPNAHDDATNEALAQWYRQRTSTPTVADRDNFLRQYREEKAAQNSQRNARAYQPPQTSGEPTTSAGGLRPLSGEGNDSATIRATLKDQGYAPGFHPLQQNQGFLATPAAIQQAINGTDPAVWQKAQAGKGNPSIYLANEDQRKIDEQRQAQGTSPADSTTDPTSVKSAGDVSSQDVLLSTLKPDQLTYLSDINKQVPGLLTDDQRKQIESGKETMQAFLDQLSPPQQEKIKQLSQGFLDTLTQEQTSDLLFLNSGMLGGIDLQKRQAILQRLKETGGKISFDDLVRIGVYQPDDLAAGGLKRWLQNLNIYGPAHAHDLLEGEYKLSNLGTSFADMDTEQRQRLGEQIMMMATLAALPLAEAKYYGSSDIAIESNVDDNTKEQRTPRPHRFENFINLEGLNHDEIMGRIPSDAARRELYPVEGGASEGFEYKWVQDGQTWRLRVHGPDAGAPSGSNAANGWTMRIQRGRQYWDPTIHDFQPAKYTNASGDFFDDTIMNNTHIPVQSK